MNVLIVDDEPLARERLAAMLQEIEGDYVLAGEAANGIEALEQIERLQPDIVLLDIHMPGMGGIEVARHLLQREDSPAVIFTTAYDEYALAAFEAQAVGYLLKPVDAAQLTRSLNTACILQEGQLKEVDSVAGTKRSFISFRLRGDLQLVPVSDVRYFRAEQKYVEMRHSDGIALIEESLKSLEDEFADQFVRIHRNALVANKAIAGLERDSLGRSHIRLFGCDERLDVSRRHVSEVRQLLKSRS